MSIRIGSSCALSVPMAIGRVVETRLFISGTQSKWDEVSKYCIANKIYLIVTPCINRNDGSGHYPNDTEWKSFIDSTCQKLKNWGANRYNARLSLVNEPMKFCSREQYKHLIDIAYPIVKGYGFLCGAGNEEFLTAQAKGNMYQYILANCQFDILDIHIQGSCDSPEKTEFWCNTARSWTSKPIYCPEAFYSNIATSGGWNLLKSQMENAERIGCSNFCNVFNNLDTTMFPFNTSDWHKLCFKINGVLRSNYWSKWNTLIESKAPIPNIPPSPIIIEGEDMKLILLKKGSKGNQVKWLQRILLENYQVPNPSGVDGIFGSQTEQQVRDYQEEKELVIDGIVGTETTIKLIEESSDPKKWQRILVIYASFQ
ncbi:MAG: peptidoglycan-binding domain-containing protein [Atribacterota bacterium]|nr:peptidoglycan-binding domain-containing protein [Atribacterota bacterium]